MQDKARDLKSANKLSPGKVAVLLQAKKGNKLQAKS